MATALVSLPPRPRVVDVVVPVHPLEAGDNDDPPFIQFPFNPLGVDLLNPGAGVVGVGIEAGLMAIERNDRIAHRFNRHRHQRSGNLLAGRQEHIHLPLAGAGVDFPRLFNQVVGGVPLGGDDGDDVVAGLVGVQDDVGDIEDPFFVFNGCPAKLLHNESHSCLHSIKGVKGPVPRRRPFSISNPAPG